VNVAKFIFISNGDGAEKGIDYSDISAIEIDSRGLTILLKSRDKLVIGVSQSFPRKGNNEFSTEEIREFYELLKREVSQSNE
jgi:hypothetical protein